MAATPAERHLLGAPGTPHAETSDRRTTEETTAPTPKTATVNEITENRGESADRSRRGRMRKVEGSRT